MHVIKYVRTHRIYDSKRKPIVNFGFGVMVMGNDNSPIVANMPL